MYELTHWLGYFGFFFCLFLMAYGFFAPRPKEGSAPRPTRCYLFIQAALIFLAIWLWLRVTLPVVGWALWYGDRHHWFPEYSNYVAMVIAVAYAGFISNRVAARQASEGYLRLHFSAPIALLLLLGVTWAIVLVGPIEGATPRAAAERHLRDLEFDEPVNLVEDPQPNWGTYLGPNTKTFWIMGKNEPRGRIAVRPYGWYWWTFTAYSGFPPSHEELRRAKERLVEGPKREAPQMLQRIVNDYPGTESAKEAQGLLDTLEQSKASRPRKTVR